MGATEELQTIIGNQPLCNVYEEYLCKTSAWENFGFYHEVESYRQLENLQDRQEKAHEIYDQFLACDAPFELGDINREIRERLAPKLDEGNPDLFSALQRTAFRQLARSSVSDFLDDQLFYAYRDTLFTCGATNANSVAGSLWLFCLPSCLSS